MGFFGIGKKKWEEKVREAEEEAAEEHAAAEEQTTDEEPAASEDKPETIVEDSVVKEEIRWSLGRKKGLGEKVMEQQQWEESLRSFVRSEAKRVHRSTDELEDAEPETEVLEKVHIDTVEHAVQTEPRDAAQVPESPDAVQTAGAHRAETGRHQLIRGEEEQAPTHPRRGSSDDREIDTRVHAYLEQLGLGEDKHETSQDIEGETVEASSVDETVESIDTRAPAKTSAAAPEEPAPQDAPPAREKAASETSQPDAHNESVEPVEEAEIEVEEEDEENIEPAPVEEAEEYEAKDIETVIDPGTPLYALVEGICGYGHGELTFELHQVEDDMHYTLLHDGSELEQGIVAPGNEWFTAVAALYVEQQERGITWSRALIMVLPEDEDSAAVRVSYTDTADANNHTEDFIFQAAAGSDAVDELEGEPGEDATEDITEVANSTETAGEDKPQGEKTEDTPAAQTDGARESAEHAIEQPQRALENSRVTADGANTSDTAQKDPDAQEPATVDEITQETRNPNAEADTGAGEEDEDIDGMAAALAAIVASADAKAGAQEPRQEPQKTGTENKADKAEAQAAKVDTTASAAGFLSSADGHTVNRINAADIHVSETPSRTGRRSARSFDELQDFALDTGTVTEDTSWQDTEATEAKPRTGSTDASATEIAETAVAKTYTAQQDEDTKVTGAAAETAQEKTYAERRPRPYAIPDYSADEEPDYSAGKLSGDTPLLKPYSGASLAPGGLGNRELTEVSVDIEPDVPPSAHAASVASLSGDTLASGNLALTDAQVAELLDPVKRALYGEEGTAKDATAVLIRVRSLGSYYDVITHVRRGGVWEHARTFELVPEDSLDIPRIKTRSYSEGEGSPLAMSFTFTPGVPVQSAFDYFDEQAFVRYPRPVEPERYIEELRLFPRLGAKIPAHMAAALTKWNV